MSKCVTHSSYFDSAAWSQVIDMNERCWCNQEWGWCNQEWGMRNEAFKTMRTGSPAFFPSPESHQLSIVCFINCLHRPRAWRRGTTWRLTVTKLSKFLYVFNSVKSKLTRTEKDTPITKHIIKPLILVDQLNVVASDIWKKKFLHFTILYIFTQNHLTWDSFTET